MERQHPGGGWSYEPASTQAALEPTCLALLALRWDSSPARARGLQFLIGAQNPNGSWPGFSGDDQEGSGLTALAVIALINSGEMSLHAERGLKWLLNSKGKESHWLWKWKFRTSDTRVRFDPDKFGWPWMPGTCSWVIPTAFSIIALKQAFVCCKTDEVSLRIRRGKEMLERLSAARRMRSASASGAARKCFWIGPVQVEDGMPEMAWFMAFLWRHTSMPRPPPCSPCTEKR